jgi:hypothetical protein
MIHKSRMDRALSSAKNTEHGKVKNSEQQQREPAHGDKRDYSFPQRQVELRRLSGQRLH